MHNKDTSRFLLTIYVGLILRSTTVATTSCSTLEGTMRALCTYHLPSSFLAFCHSSVRVTSLYPQRYYKVLTQPEQYCIIWDPHSWWEESGCVQCFNSTHLSQCSISSSTWHLSYSCYNCKDTTLCIIDYHIKWELTKEVWKGNQISYETAVILKVTYGGKLLLCVHDLSPRGKGNSCLLGGLSYEKIRRYNNSPPYVTARWQQQQNSPHKFPWD